MALAKKCDICGKLYETYNSKDNQLGKLIEGIGSMADMAAIIRDALINNGFTRS